MLTSREGLWGGIFRKFGIDVHTALLKMGNQQEPAVYQGELCSIFYNNLTGKRL